MAVAHFRMLINELSNKDPYIVTYYSPLIILESKSAFCMSNTGKDTKHTRHVYRRVHFVRNDEKWKMHRIDWCEEGLKLANIATKNVDENTQN